MTPSLALTMDLYRCEDAPYVVMLSRFMTGEGMAVGVWTVTMGLN